MGFLPSAANNMAIVASVSAIAIRGDATAAAVERSARRSSTNRMTQVLSVPPRAAAGLALGCAAAHQQAERFAGGGSGVDRLRKPAVENHRDAIGDFFKFLEILADHEHGGGAYREIDQRLADGRGRPRGDAPSRLRDRQHAGLAEGFP